MTVIFSAVSEQGVVVSADSAVSNDFGAFTEYATDRKLWHVPSCGFVAAWGARVGMNLGQLLATEWAEANGRSVSDLARFVHEYLVSEYRPDETRCQDLLDREPLPRGAEFRMVQQCVVVLDTEQLVQEARVTHVDLR